MSFDVMRVSIQGSATGGEVWTVNPVFGFGDFASDTPTFEEMSAAAQAVADVALPTTLRAVMGASLSRVGARLEARQLDGSLEVVGEATSTSPTPGTAASTKPYQVAAVYSLRSAVPGARGRGRLYWPATGATMSTATLRWDATQQAASTAEFAQYLENLGDAMEGPLGLAGSTLVVWSRTALARYPVISMNAGDVFDTQRRRRDRAVESYVSVSYPPA